MGKHPNLGRLDYLAENDADFQLTGTKYEELTGVPLPKGKSYLLNDSALARWAKEHGYLIEDITEKPMIERTVIFKRNERKQK